MTMEALPTLQISEADWATLDPQAARADRLIFYGVAVSSFLEITIEHYTAALRVVFRGEPEVLEWLDRVWEPEERAHGHAMRAYLARVWPAYDWERAYAGFIGKYAPLCAADLMRPTPAREMLARCVTECQAAVLYRTLASLAADPLARSLFQRMYEEEVSHYKYFYRWFRILREREQLGAMRVFRDIVVRQRLAKGEDFDIALAHVEHGFCGNMPFAPLERASISIMARTALEDHFPFDTARAMMLKPLRACESWRGNALAAAMDAFYRIGQRVVV